jgi:hypothetical protein
MLEFLIDNIFVSFGGILFQQVVGELLIEKASSINLYVKLKALAS